MSIACVLSVLTQYMRLYCYWRCCNWQYEMAVHENLVYSLWVLLTISYCRTAKMLTYLFNIAIHDGIKYIFDHVSLRRIFAPSE